MSISTAHLPLAYHSNDASQQCAVDIQLVAENEPRRSDIEHFIQVVFKRAYGAKIHHFLPYLLSMQQDDKLVAALGIRPAKEQRLFLETYLDAPIENTLAEKTRCPIDRSRIVEVGNLASVHGGGARALIITLTAYLKGAGYEWAVFTATPKVRNNFARLGIQLIPLINADKTRLGAAQHDWGSYYEQEPIVVATSVNGSSDVLTQAMLAQQLFPTAQQLWNDAHRAGRQGCLWQPPRTLAASWPQWMLDNDTAHDFDFDI